MAKSTAIRRYERAVLALSIAYGVLLVGAAMLFDRHIVSGSLGYVVAILPALPVIGIFAAIGRYLVDERDEYVRMLMVRQTLIASGFSLSICTAWGFLESFGLVPKIELYWVAVLWFGGLGLGACVNRFAAGPAE